ncbi:(Na+)-NQR maturation NqrM [bacterium SCSIO 12696]|nr:(Na+)-NQR maturation NqrM [bacterium SCSIO 12696]
MLTFVLAIVLVVLLIAGMAIGVIMGRKPLAGSCGGVGAALGEDDYSCDLCGGDPKKCESLQNDEGADTSLAYDATRKDSPGR